MNGPITVGAAHLMGSLVGLAGLARWWVRPARPVEEPAPRRGRHRAPAALATAPLVATEPAPEPVEALVYETAHCPTCHADTEHVHFALGGLMCPSCPPWGA